jgi:uncharacterized protein
MVWGNHHKMKTKPLTFLLALTFLFLFCGSVYGDDYQDGLGAQERKDYKAEVNRYRRGADQGDTNAQVNLGAMYYTGKGVPQDYKEAARLFRLSAEQGNVGGQLNLGRLYQFGKGVPQDYKEAVKWYRLSAEQGLALAQSHLSSMYYLGQGVPQDYVLAHMWWNLAGSNGHKDSVKNRNIVEKKMTPSQIEEAQRLARNWKPKKK